MIEHGFNSVAEMLQYVPGVGVVKPPGSTHLLAKLAEGWEKRRRDQEEEGEGEGEGEGESKSKVRDVCV